MKTEEWTLLSISLPKRGEEDSSMIRNSCENSSPSYSLKNNLLACPDSPTMEADWEESGPEASVSTEKVAPISKRKSTGWPHTVINTRGSSGVIRMGACVGTPGHLQS